MNQRAFVGGDCMGTKKRKAPSSLERGRSLSPSASPFAGRGVKSVLHRCWTSSLPKADKPHPDKEEGRNKAEKELAVANHDVVAIRCECQSIFGEHNSRSSFLSRAGSAGSHQIIDERQDRQ